MTDCNCPTCTLFRGATEAAETLNKLGYDDLGNSVTELICHAAEADEALDTVMIELQEQGIDIEVVDSVETVH